LTKQARGIAFSFYFGDAFSGSLEKKMGKRLNDGGDQ